MADPTNCSPEKNGQTTSSRFTITPNWAAESCPGLLGIPVCAPKICSPSTAVVGQIVNLRRIVNPPPSDIDNTAQAARFAGPENLKPPRIRPIHQLPLNTQMNHFSDNFNIIKSEEQTSE